MKKWILLLAVLVLMVPFSVVQADKNAVAEEYAVTLTLQPDGSLEVTERVVFRFEGGPFTYYFRHLPLRELDSIDRLAAGMDGETLTEGMEEGQVEIERGDPIVLTWHFAPAADTRHEFTLTYRVLGAVRQEDGDTLIWRAIPEDHDYPIERVTLTLLYPQGALPLEAPQVNREGEMRRLEQGYAFTASGIEADTDVVLSVRFPAGSLIQSPPRWQERSAASGREAGMSLIGALLAAAAGLGVGVPWLVSYHRKNTRAAEQDISVPASEPPGELPPAVAARLLGSASGYMGTLFDLAGRGVVQVEEQKGWLGTKKYMLRLLPHQEALRPHEQALLDLLFKPNQTVTDLAAVGTLFGSHSSRFTLPLELEMANEGLYDLQRKKIRSRRLGIGLAVFLGSLLVFMGAMALTGLLVAGASAWSLPLAALTGLSGAVFVVSCAFLIMASGFSPLTEYGEQQAARWKNFSAYLQRVAKKKEPALRVDFFERYLPYAAAFGLGSEWANSFKGVGGVPLPVWYQAMQDSSADFSAVIAIITTADASVSSVSADGGAGGASGGGASGVG